MVDITIVTGAYKPTYNWGAPSCRLNEIMSQDVASAAARAKGSKIWRVFEQDTCRFHVTTRQFTGLIGTFPL